jgi:hypothetical protein
MADMEWLARTFFESPTPLYGVLIFVEVGLLARWLIRRGRRAALWMVLPIALGLGVFALERVVVTDREQIINNAHRLAESIHQGRARQELRRVLSRSEQFSAGLGEPRMLDRETIIERSEQERRRLDVTRVKIHRPTVEIHDGRAEMTVQTLIFYGQRGRDSLIWDIEWVKEEDCQWRIITIHPPKRGLRL